MALMIDLVVNLHVINLNEDRMKFDHENKFTVNFC